MEWIRILLSRCAALFRRKKLDADLDEELRAHIDLAIEENRSRGMNEQQARTAALRAFGGVTQIRETYRVQRGLPWLEQIASRHPLCRSPTAQVARLRAHRHPYARAGHRRGYIGLQRGQCGFAQAVRLSRPGSPGRDARGGGRYGDAASGRRFPTITGISCA